MKLFSRLDAMMGFRKLLVTELLLVVHLLKADASARKMWAIPVNGWVSEHKSLSLLLS